MGDEIILQLIKSTTMHIEKTDEINKRLVRCILGISIAFSICITIIVVSYFFSAYNYTSMEQEVKNEHGSSTQKIN